VRTQLRNSSQTARQLTASRKTTSPFHRSRLQNVSKTAGHSRGLEQPNRIVERRGTEVHVPLRRREILMSGQFLNRSCRRAAHRQMRTERVPEHMRSVIE